MEREAKDGTIYRQVTETDWEPVTRQAKNGATFKKMSGDRWEPLDTQGPIKAADKTSQAQTALEKVGEGLTAGYLPQIQAATYPAFEAVGEMITGKDIPDETYLERRDENIRRQQQMQKEHPWTSGISQAAGGLVTGIATSPLAAVGGATKAARLVQAAKTGAAYGALANPGDNEGEISPLQLGKREEGAAKGAALGVLTQLGFEAIPAAQRSLKKAGQYVYDRLKKAPNADKILEASKRLGIEPTPGMLTQSDTVKGLESSLEQSPSIGGSLVRRKTKDVRKAFSKQVDNLTKEASSLSNFEAGEAAKRSLKSQTKKTLEGPIAQFEKLANDTKNITLPEKSLKSISRNIRNMREVKLMPSSEWGTKANRYADAIENATTVNDIKTLRSVVGGEIDAAEGPSRKILTTIYGKLTKLEENQIKRGAIEAAKGMGRGTKKFTVDGKKIAKEMLEELRGAKKGYGEVAQGLKELSKQAGMKRTKTPHGFIRMLDDMRPEEVVNKLSNVKNVRLLNTLKDRYPEAFKIMREQKIGDMLTKSTNRNGELSTPVLLRQVKSMGDDAIELIFGSKNSVKVLEDLRTVFGSTPYKMGPSGTPQGMQFADAVNPIMQGKELARYTQYRALTSPKTMATADRLRNIQPMTGETKRIVPGVLGVSNATSKKDTDEFGSSKELAWKNKGLEAVLEATGNDDLYGLKYSRDKEVISLLVQASSLNKNSKMFKKIIKKLKAKAGVL